MGESAQPDNYTVKKIADALGVSEVKISTGVWSGFGRLATLRDYGSRPYIIITYNDKKFQQVINQFPEVKNRFIHVLPEQIELLYSAEKNLIAMRQEFNLE